MQKTIVTKIDDVSGKEFSEGETVTFAVNGQSFEIDLNKFNARNFHRSMAKYMEHGRKVTGGRTHVSRDVKHAPEYVHTVRAWAAENGIEVSSRGRVPLSVYAAYESANA